MGFLDGKVAIVTGAGGGIGRAHALLLAQEGAKVVVNDLGGDRHGKGKGTSMADAVVAEIRKAGGKAIANYDSVAELEGARRMVQAAVDEYGGIDILICNAGILRDKTLQNMTVEMWNDVMNVHLNGTFYCTKAAYDRMIEQGRGGRILCTSSASGLFGNFGQTNYGAAKAGIAGFVRCLWQEGQKHKITVNGIAPGAFTRMTEDLLPGGQSGDFAKKWRPEHVSPVVVWLCSDEAAGVTGRIFSLHGNEVSLVEPVRTKIADRTDNLEPWNPAEIGPKVLEFIKKKGPPPRAMG